METKLEAPDNKSGSQITELYTKFLIELSQVNSLANDQKLSQIFYFYLKQFQMLQEIDLDDDIDTCFNDGISLLNGHIVANCNSIDRFQAMFNETNEIPTQLGSVLPMLINTITLKKNKFGGKQKKTGGTGIVLDLTK